jgi:hypothetical protein
MLNLICAGMWTVLAVLTIAFQTDASWGWAATYKALIALMFIQQFVEG